MPPAVLQFQHQFDHLFWIWSSPHFKFSPRGFVPSGRSRCFSLCVCWCVCVRRVWVSELKAACMCYLALEQAYVFIMKKCEPFYCRFKYVCASLWPTIQVPAGPSISCLWIRETKWQRNQPSDIDWWIDLPVLTCRWNNLFFINQFLYFGAFCKNTSCWVNTDTFLSLKK